MSLMNARERHGLTVVEDGKGPLPCMWCQRSTPWATLSNYGARCLECYGTYERSVQPAPRYDKRAEGPKAWAYSLKSREESGERLSSMQKTMWKAAIGTSEEHA